MYSQHLKNSFFFRVLCRQTTRVAELKTCSGCWCCTAWPVKSGMSIPNLLDAHVNQLCTYYRLFCSCCRAIYTQWSVMSNRLIEHILKGFLEDLAFVVGTWSAALCGCTRYFKHDLCIWTISLPLCDQSLLDMSVHKVMSMISLLIFACFRNAYWYYCITSNLHVQRHVKYVWLSRNVCLKPTYNLQALVNNHQGCFDMLN